MEGRRGIRTESVNTEYYGKRNYLSFFQFKEYHFTDSQKRKYTIATENDDTFQNESLRFSPDSLRSREGDRYGEVLLYVKLARKTGEWFEEKEMNRPMIINDKRTKEAYTIVIRSSYRADYKSRSGSISVARLERSVCDRILLEHSTHK